MDPINIILLVTLCCLLLLSAFFSSAETAITTISKVRVRMLNDDGNKKAKILSEILEKPNKMLTTILVGNNIVNLSASSITTIFINKQFKVGWAISIGVGVLTFLIIIFGEIIPKTVARVHSESLALAYARPIKSLMSILSPIIFILNLFSTVILKIFRININLNSSTITEDELRTLMDVSEEEGIIETEEKDMINNVFDFGDACVKDVLVPKVDVTMIPIDITYDELMNVISDVKYTRFPVYRDDTDNVTGILNIKDMLIEHIDKSNFKLTNLIREPFFTYELKELNDLLVEMRNEDTSMCVVLDEYGQTEGIITLEDIIEEIIGEIRDEFDEDEKEVIRKIKDNLYLVEGSVNLDDFNERLGTDIDSEIYESLGGLIIETLERIPKRGDTVKIGNLLMRVTRMDGRRIDYVRVRIENPTPKQSVLEGDDE